MRSLQTEHLAMLAVAVSGFAWGLYWIPLRALDQAGINGVWAIALFQTLPMLIMIPALIWRRRQLIRGGMALHIAGILAGTSLVLYAGALVFTDVVRALLLYYLTPLWSTLFAWMFIGEAITRARWATIVLALAGLLVIVEWDAGPLGAFNTGDWMGLTAGIIWAVAAVRMRSDKHGNGIDFTLSYFIWGSLAALLLTLLPLKGSGSPPDWDTILSVLPWIIPVVLVLAIPPAFAVMWGATMISPGLLAILFMTEITSGTITAAIWAGEAIGLREVTGVILITTAGLIEPVLSLRRPRANPGPGAA